MREERKSDRKSDRKGGKGGSSRYKSYRKKACKLCADKLDQVDYKDRERLERFISERGKILPRRVSGTCARHQRFLSRAIKRARELAMLPFVAE